MQPVQNITVDDRVSRTQFQYTLEDPDINELNQWTNQFVAKLKQLPDLADVATDQQTGANAVSLMIDRVTASRLGVAPGTMDNTLYDAYGQRQISTMYTQLNQYHVILEAMPSFQQDPDQLNKLYIQSGTSNGASGPGAATSFAASGSSSAGSNATTGSALYTPSANTLTPPAKVITTSNNGSNTTTVSTAASAVPLSAFSHYEHTTGAALDHAPGAVSSGDCLFQSGAERRTGKRDHRYRQGRSGDELPPQPAGRFPGNSGLLQEFAVE